MIQSCQIHLCDVMKSIGMGSSNISHIDAKWNLNSLKKSLEQYDSLDPTY